MEITVKLLSTFARYRKSDDDIVSLQDGSCVSELVEELGLPRKLIRIIVVNGKQADLHTVLSAGDMVFLLPPALGGG